MKIVLNKNYGGFSLPEGFLSAYDFDNVAYIERTDERLVEWVENNLDGMKYYSDLDVVEIPDEATDWEIDEYDGWESVIYVVNGKIHHI